RRYSHMSVRSLVLLVLALLSSVAPAASQIRAETSGRKATTLGALTTYAGFYHLQPVRVRAKLVTDQVGTALLSGETRLLALGDAATAQVTGDVEVTGTFIDVGRLARDDQRVATYGLAALSE